MPSLAAQIRYAKANAECDPTMAAILASLLDYQKFDPAWRKRRSDLIYADWKSSRDSYKVIGARHGVSGGRVGQIVQKNRTRITRNRIKRGWKCLSCSVRLADEVVTARYYSRGSEDVDIFYGWPIVCQDCGHEQKIDRTSDELCELDEEELASVAKDKADKLAEHERALRLDEKWPCPGCGKISRVSDDVSPIYRRYALSGHGLPPWLVCSTCGYLQIVDREIVRHEPTTAERELALGSFVVQQFLATLNPEHRYAYPPLASTPAPLARADADRA